MERDTDDPEAARRRQSRRPLTADTARGAASAAPLRRPQDAFSAARPASQSALLQQRRDAVSVARHKLRKSHVSVRAGRGRAIWSRFGVNACHSVCRVGQGGRQCWRSQSLSLADACCRRHRRRSTPAAAATSSASPRSSRPSKQLGHTPSGGQTAPSMLRRKGYDQTCRTCRFPDSAVHRRRFGRWGARTGVFEEGRCCDQAREEPRSEADAAVVLALDGVAGG
jgi:hypothetical protein